MCKEIISFEDFYHRLHGKKKLVVIFFMLWKEVVEHICNRGSPMKRLPNRSCSQAGFPPLRCFLWPGYRFKSAVRPVVSDRYLQVRAVDEVMVSLSLTEEQGRKFDCGSFNRESFQSSQSLCAFRRLYQRGFFGSAAPDLLWNLPVGSSFILPYLCQGQDVFCLFCRMSRGGFLRDGLEPRA